MGFGARADCGAKGRRILVVVVVLGWWQPPPLHFRLHLRHGQAGRLHSRVDPTKQQQQQHNNNSGAASKAGPLVVDGPEEVRRVCSSVDRILRRRRRQLEVTGGGGGNEHLSITNASDCSVDFILRLPGLDPDEWRSILQNTARALAEHCCRLVGISFDLSFPAAASDTDQQSRHLEAIESLLDYLADFDVVDKDLRIDLTGVPLVAASTTTTGRNVATTSQRARIFTNSGVLVESTPPPATRRVADYSRRDKAVGGARRCPVHAYYRCSTARRGAPKRWDR